MKDHMPKSTVPDPSAEGYVYLGREGLTKNDLVRGHNRTDKVGKVMGEFKRGNLRSSSGERVTGRDQALAIALSEQRRQGRS